MSRSINTEHVNGIDLKVLQDTVEAVKQDPELAKCHFRIQNKWNGGTQNRTMVRDFHAAKSEHQHKHDFELEHDEPPMLSGQDEAPNPVEHLLNALAGCVTTSLVAHAAVRGISIEEVESELEGDIDLSGFLGIKPEVPKGYTNIRMKLRVKSDEKNTERLKELAEFSPVYNTLLDGVDVDLQVEPK